MTVFDAQWRKECTIEPCRVAELAAFIQAHYLRKRPAIVELCLMMRHVGVPVGCVVYSAPCRELSVRYGGKTWELARVYLLDAIPKNAETWLIGKSVKYIKRERSDVEHLVSYADPSAGHSGVIYRAANWIADGRTDDKRKTPRCDYVDQRTGKKYGRRGNVPVGAQLVRVPRVSKFRYTLPLNPTKRGQHDPM